MNDQVVDWLCDTCTNFSSTPTVSEDVASPACELVSDSLIESLISPVPNHSHDPKSFFDEWISTHVESSSNNSPVPCSVLMEKYFKACNFKGYKALVPASFGTLLRKFFPETKHKRIGGRKKLAYHYYKIRYVDPEALPQKSDISDLGKELSKLRRVIPTLRRCPKGARREVAESLIIALTEVLSSNDVVSWGKLLKFPYKALRVPHKSEKVRNLTTFVKSAASNWSASTFQKTPAPNQWKLPTQLADHSIIKKADGDIQRAIRLLGSDDLIAPNTQDTVDSLLSKHPCHPQPSVFPTEPETVEIDPISVEEEMKAVVFSIRLRWWPGSLKTSDPQGRQQ